MQAVWGMTAVSHGALDTLVNTVRDKLGGSQPGYIATVRGTGYALLDEADSRIAPPARPPQWDFKP
jgi:DNA-binding winged helix-turn-helix (wHTH) protein